MSSAVQDPDPSASLLALPSWRKNVVLDDGTPLSLRPMSPADDEKLLRLFDRLSPSSIYSRFLGVVRRFSVKEIQRFTHVDFSRDMAIVATVEDATEPEGEKIIAVGRYVRLADPSHAEVAFTVEDAYQAHGIGTLLLRELLPFAREAQIEVLEAEVLAQNRAMLKMFGHVGVRGRRTVDAGVVHIRAAI